MTNRIIEVVRRGAAGVDGSFGLTTVSARATSFIAIADERAYAYRCTAALTISLTAASGLQSGWHALVLADGGDVTIDPDGAELINGQATLVIPDGAMIWLFTDGNAFYAQFMMSDLVTAILGSTTPEGVRAALELAELDTTLTTAGTSSAYTATSTATIPSLYAGLRVRIIPHVNCVSGATFNLNGLGALPIMVKGGTEAVNGSDVAVRSHVDLEYSTANGGEWHVVNAVRASETVAGLVEKATTAEVASGTANRFIDAELLQEALSGTAKTEIGPTTLTGTEADFTTIPNDVTEIEIGFLNASLSGSDNFLIQLSTGSAFETSAYVSGSASGGSGANSTAGFIVFGASQPSELSGIITLRKVPDADTWISSHSLSDGSVRYPTGGGSKALGGAVDGVRITVTGADTFDNGSVFIRYK